MPLQKPTTQPARRATQRSTFRTPPRQERSFDQLFDRVPGGDRDIVSTFEDDEDDRYDGWSNRAGQF